jgi:16S rRNA (guanine1207-N2)-methyltransferase
VNDRRQVGHYFDAHPASSSAPREIELALPDVTLRLTTDRGVFSASVVDPGTKLLLLSTPSRPDDLVIADIGCGYGAIALTAAHRSPRAIVWAVDVNDRARTLCRDNAVRAGCGDRVRAVTPDEVPPDIEFDAIYSNPPIRVGKSALHDIIERWLARLRPDGVAYFVVQKHLGADSLARWMRDQGFNVTRAAARQSYRVLEVRRNAK